MEISHHPIALIAKPVNEDLIDPGAMDIEGSPIDTGKVFIGTEFMSPEFIWISEQLGKKALPTRLIAIIDVE